MAATDDMPSNGTFAAKQPCAS